MSHIEINENEIIDSNIISVIGAGSWGTSIAKVLAENSPKQNIKLWAYEKSVVKSINENRKNNLYLPDIELPSNIVATNHLKESIFNSKIIILITPSKVVYETCLKIAKNLSPKAIIGCFSKGFCRVNNEILTISEAIVKAIPTQKGKVAVIYGPSHAEEVSRRYHSCLTVASNSKESREKMVKLLTCDYLVCRETEDVKGVELGGTLKNPAAIAAGILSVLPQCGDNLAGALMSEALKEIMRLGKCMGVQDETLIDISGLGDLITTSLSDYSRNRRFGKDIAKKIIRTGKSINFYDRLVMHFRPEYVVEKLSERLNYLAEGAYAIEPIIELSQQYGVSIPVYQSLYEILLNKKNPELLIETVKNPEKFEEVYEKIKIQTTNKKKGMEKIRGTIFKKIIIKNTLQKFLDDPDLKDRLYEYRNSILNENSSKKNDNNHIKGIIGKEFRLFKDLNEKNFNRIIKDFCKVYIKDVTDNFNIFIYKVFVKYIRILNILNRLFGKGQGKRFFENNIKVSGNLENTKNNIEAFNIVYVSTYRSYLDFINISMAIDRAGLHIPRFFVERSVVNNKFKRFLLKFFGGYIIDAKKFSNPIYRELTSKYLSILLQHGVPILFFPELEISRDGSIGGIDHEFLIIIMESLFKNTEEIALVPIEISYYERPSEIMDEGSGKSLIIKNFLKNRVMINFSDPIFASDFSNINMSIAKMAESISEKWKSDSYIFSHYILCDIIKQNNYKLKINNAKSEIEKYLKKYNMEKNFNLKGVQNDGLNFIVKSGIGYIKDNEIYISKTKDVDYYSNLVY